MPSNVEIKAHVIDIDIIKQKAVALSGSEGTLIQQEDTFFKVPNGRLKLRVLKGEPSQLIYYKRPDASGPKTSEYHITEVDNPSSLKITLGYALATVGEVKKDRMLYMVGQTRVHVDHVHGLGNFMELEVVMKDGQTEADGQEIAHTLMKQLDITEADLITGAYMDMILQNNSAAFNGTTVESH